MKRKTTPPKKGVSREKDEKRSAAARKAGSVTSPAKAAAVRENGKLGGRPTDYRPELCEEMVKFFDVDETKIETKTIVKNGDTITVEERVANDLPTLQGFCRQIGVSARTLLNWKASHPDFDEAYEIAKTHQERMILVNGFAGRYVSPMATLFAKTKMGFVERVEVTGGDGGAIQHSHTHAIEAETQARMVKLLARMKLTGTDA